MRIGLIDVDGGNFPNLPLMKISAWHKSKGDSVEWHEPMSGHYDKVYMSKVFTFTDDYDYFIDADEIIRGGTGYAIELVDGKEVFHKEYDDDLPYEIEHIYPDYSIYFDKIPKVKETAYGFLSRGCSRGCFFCVVARKEGPRVYKCADLSEFWNGQKYIEIMDPNILACPQWEELFDQLIASKAHISFNQGLDVRLITPEKVEKIKQLKLKSIHFAFDRYQDKEIVMRKLKEFHNLTKYERKEIQVYVLVNYDTTLEQDLERIYFIKSLNFSPYVMRYDKEHIPRNHILNKLARYVNFRQFFWGFESFDEYLEKEKTTH